MGAFAVVAIWSWENSRSRESERRATSGLLIGRFQIQRCVFFLGCRYEDHIADGFLRPNNTTARRFEAFGIVHGRRVQPESTSDTVHVRETWCLLLGVQ